MPLTKLQIDVLTTIAANRNPGSVIAGGIPLARAGARESHDIDIFHTRSDALVAAFNVDAATLTAAGFTVTATKIGTVFGKAEITFERADVSRDGQTVVMEWVADSDFRYFPTLPDKEFGYVLNPIDLGINKIWAAVGRSELRDIIDLDHITNKYLPLGPLAAAAVEIDPGYTPELMLNEMMRNTKRTPEEYDQVPGIDRATAIAAIQSYREKINEARAYVMNLPTDKLGILFLKDGVPVQPDTSRLADYTEHRPKRQGHWPGTPDIRTEMLAVRHGIDWDRARSSTTR